MTRLFRGLTTALIPLAAIAAASAPGASSAQSPSAPKDVQACASCHGPAGVSASPAIPNLAGQKPAYLEAQLKAFKSKDRKNAFMNPIAGQLSDGDIHDLAVFWSSLPAAADGHGQTASAPIPSKMTWPAGFPAGFTLYQTLPSDKGVTKRYANAIALKAARAGQPLPEGSVIIGASYAAAKDASGATVAGAIQSYEGMESRPGWGAGLPRLLQNGDFHYGQFTTDGQTKPLNQAACLACHKAVEGDSYVYSMKALRGAG
jgi:cytochrome c553